MGREGVGIYMMRNHEGISRPVSGKGDQAAHRAKRRRRGSEMRPLTYLIGDLPGFPVIFK